MKYYYAEYDDGDWIVLRRFESKEQRDQYVKDRPNTASAITKKLAMMYHKDQFNYWKNNK